MGRGWGILICTLYKSLDCHEQNAGRTMDVKDYSGEISNGNEKHVLETWKKDDLYDKVTKNLVEVCSSIL